jgi:hypothetical protein
VPTSPPFGFPVFGLDASWPGARWLDSFGDQVGDPPWRVTLGHQSADGESLILVETYSRPPADDLAARRGEPPLEDVAIRAAVILNDVTLPVQSVSRPDGFLPVLVEHAMEIAGQHMQWPAVGWRVDGTPVSARVSWFAGGWAAISDGVAEVYLSAVGVGTSPDSLSLARLRDGTGYHFDLEQPLPPGVRSASRRAAHVRFEAPWQRRQDWHADQLRLMRESGRTSAE